MSSPGSAMTPISAPMGAGSPAGTRILRRTPAPNASISTSDKADVEMEAFGAGVLRKILVPAGEPAPIGALIGVIADPGDDISGLLASAPTGAAGAGSDAQKTPLRPEPAPAAPVGAASAAQQ